MWLLVSFTVGMALGLYAGKKRVRGKTWCEICSDLHEDVAENVKSLWCKACGPFKREMDRDEEHNNV